MSKPQTRWYNACYNSRSMAGWTIMLRYMRSGMRSTARAWAPKRALELSVAEPRPWEDIMGDLAGVANITRAESRARRGLPDDTPAPAEPYEVVDAELVDEPDAPEMPSSSTGDTRTGDEPSGVARDAFAPATPG